MKYKITKEKITHDDRILHRIRSKDTEELGGFIQDSSNLSQEGRAWVGFTAKVYGRAIVEENAEIHGAAEVYGFAIVKGDARIDDYAKIYDGATVEGKAMVSGHSKVHGHSIVKGDAKVSGYSDIGDISRVTGNAKIYNGKVYADGRIRTGYLEGDMFENMREYIAASLGVYPVNGVYYLYKKVNRIREGVYYSTHDSTFMYRDGEIARAAFPNPRLRVSCGRGLHVSEPFYWSLGGNTTIQVEVKERDVITCLSGKLRVKKLKVVGEI